MQQITKHREDNTFVLKNIRGQHPWIEDYITKWQLVMDFLRSTIISLAMFWIMSE